MTISETQAKMIPGALCLGAFLDYRSETDSYAT
jgi:hypothetical protein